MSNLSKLSDFKRIWTVIGLFSILQISYIFVCHLFGNELRHPLELESQIILRTVFYIIAIIMFPFTRLMRYILIRLNQTMPSEKSIAQRYFIIVMISQILMEMIGLFGFILFILGDGFNTLYIFSGLAFLGFFLYRPTQEEYQFLHTQSA